MSRRRPHLTPFEQTLQDKFEIVDKDISVPIGWENILISLFEKLKEQSFDFSTINQIKVKFGGLRFYYSTDDKTPPDKKKDWDSVIDLYVDLINDFCMRCGIHSENLDKRTTCQKCSQEELDILTKIIEQKTYEAKP